ncbi:GNAT family N-acetyltransferase [Guptibacillus hwajinpoensis]|uniref:RimJ/RimL family protein N-acetyltransferase n=1 Tax=Guptibacillus hwajinpoensis TaxID=208199 RepID=A0ABU0K6H6_9BACL|nr:GNAT family protein [Alkalihalobacillus hemicentroti]MDQ0483894.1 RimJ/RimL family protein N-acetyltransferase [Alkalihalobacillus hemicentroti]
MIQNQFKTIESSRVRLRAFKAFDLDNFVHYRANPDVARYQSWENFTREQGVKFIEEMTKASFNSPGEYYQIAIELKETNELIGDCVMHPLKDDPKQVEIGFTLDPQFQGKGYAYEAVKCLVHSLFTDLSKHRITAITDVKNEPSIKLLERLGMRREGHFHQNIWFKGEWGSEYLYAILAEEWTGE